MTAPQQVKSTNLRLNAATRKLLEDFSRRTRRTLTASAEVLIARGHEAIEDQRRASLPPPHMTAGSAE